MLALAEIIGSESSYPNTFQTGKKIDEVAEKSPQQQLKVTRQERTSHNCTPRVSLGNAVDEAH
jgi:hypothetical protein